MPNPLPLDFLREPIVGKDGRASEGFSQYLRKAVEASIAAVITRPPSPTQGAQGKIASTAVVQGRSETLATTVQNVSPTGQLQAAGVGFNADNVPNGATHAITTNNQVTGAGRAFNALDANSRLANTFRNTAVNVSMAPTSSTTLSNDGVSTAIAIAAHGVQFGAGLVNYGSGSVDPGSFGKSFIITTDPTFAGGAVAYSVSALAQSQTATEGTMSVGAVTTVMGSAKTGGGFSGGTGGEPGGRGFPTG